MNGKPTKLDYIVVITKAVLAAICVIAICAAMFFKNYSDPATLSALFLLTGTLVGNLRGSMMGMFSSSKTDGSKPDQPLPVAETPKPAEPQPSPAQPA